MCLSFRTPKLTDMGSMPPYLQYYLMSSWYGILAPSVVAVG
jgi:hypothetical protein